MNVYVKIFDGKLKKIFDTKKDKKKLVTLTTVTDNQKEAEANFYINDRKIKTIVFKNLPPAKARFINLPVTVELVNKHTLDLSYEGKNKQIEKYDIDLENFEYLDDEPGSEDKNKIAPIIIPILILVLAAVLIFLSIFGWIKFDLGNKINNYFSSIDSSDSSNYSSIDNKKDTENDSIVNKKTPDKLTDENDSAFDNESSQNDEKIEESNNSSIDGIKEDIDIEDNKDDNSQVDKEINNNSVESSSSTADVKAFTLKEQLQNDINKYLPVYYLENRWDLTGQEKQKIYNIAKELKKYKEIKIHIIGHTESVNIPENEMKLSVRRANYIKYMLTGELENRNITYTIEGKGAESPVVRNASLESEKRLNRRSEILVILVRD